MKHSKVLIKIIFLTGQRCACLRRKVDNQRKVGTEKGEEIEKIKRIDSPVYTNFLYRNIYKYGIIKTHLIYN